MVGTGLGKRVLRVKVGGGCGVCDVLPWVRLVAPPGVESSPCLLADMVVVVWMWASAAVARVAAGVVC